VISPNVIWFRDHALAYREHVSRNRFSVRRGSWSKTGLSFFQLPAPFSRVAPAVLLRRGLALAVTPVSPRGASRVLLLRNDERHSIP
jgi:hypothetical protein